VAKHQPPVRAQLTDRRLGVLVLVVLALALIALALVVLNRR
jgi:hypothetical protein